jgi:hypothetical protein
MNLVELLDKRGVPYKKKYNEFLNRNNESILFSRKTG